MGQLRSLLEQVRCASFLPPLLLPFPSLAIQGGKDGRNAGRGLSTRCESRVLRALCTLAWLRTLITRHPCDPGAVLAPQGEQSAMSLHR